MAAYRGVLRKDANSDFGIAFPDLPGCVTAGRTPEEACLMAGEALALHLAGRAENGGSIPERSGLDEIMADPENRDATIVEIEAAHSIRAA